MLSGRGLCYQPIPSPEESYRMCVCVCVYVCVVCVCVCVCVCPGVTLSHYTYSEQVEKGQPGKKYYGICCNYSGDGSGDNNNDD